MVVGDGVGTFKRQDSVGGPLVTGEAALRIKVVFCDPLVESCDASPPYPLVSCLAL